MGGAPDDGRTRGAGGRQPAGAGRRARGLAGYGLLAAAGCTALAVLALPATPAASERATGTAHRHVPARALATGGGNGIERQGARQIADRARKALLAADSLHARLTDRRATSGTHRPSALDLTLDRHGDCTGSVTLGQDGRVRLVKRGDDVWARPDRRFWQRQLPSGAADDAVRFLHGRWVHGTVRSSVLKRAAGFCDLDTFRERIARAGTGAGTLHKGHPATVAGTRTVPLHARRDGRSRSLWVAAEGTPYPLRATTRDRHRDVTTDLSAFDRPVPSATPPAADSVDVRKLERRLRQQ